HTRFKCDWSSDVCSFDLTTVLNAAVMPLACRYIDDLAQALGLETTGAPLHLLHAAGGMMSVEAAKARPLALAASGPAAGVAAAEIGRASCRERGRRVGGT